MNYNTDIRIDVNIHDHPKLLALEEDIGIGAFRYLSRLWCVAAKRFPDGILRNCTELSVAKLAQYDGKKPELLALALVRHKWLDKIEGGFALHDWADHQPFVIKAPERVEQGRKAALTRWEKIRAKKAGNNDAASNAGSNAASMP